MAKTYNLVASAAQGSSTWHVHASEFCIQYDRRNHPLKNTTYNSGGYHGWTVSQTIIDLMGEERKAYRLGKAGRPLDIHYSHTDWKLNQELGIRIRKVVDLTDLTVLVVTIADDDEYTAEECKAYTTLTLHGEGGYTIED